MRRILLMVVAAVISGCSPMTVKTQVYANYKVEPGVESGVKAEVSTVINNGSGRP